MSMDATERYLTEVDAALAAQGVEDRAEILAGLREHIEEATSAEGGLTPAEVMRELGDPQAIAASAGGIGASLPTVASNGIRSKSWFSILALVLVFAGAVLAGFLVPIVLVLIGLVLMWFSARWSAREKLWGTLLVPAPGLVLWIVLGYADADQDCVTQTSGTDVQTVCTGGGGISGGVFATIILVCIALVGIAMTIRLARRALDRG